MSVGNARCRVGESRPGMLVFPRFQCLMTATAEICLDPVLLRVAVIGNARGRVGVSRPGLLIFPMFQLLMAAAAEISRGPVSLRVAVQLPVLGCMAVVMTSKVVGREIQWRCSWRLRVVLPCGEIPAFPSRFHLKHTLQG